MTAQPSPESFLRLIHRSKRGRLKVYLGYSPGVGKTYQMLLEGHRLKSQGVDVVVGFVETHGRADTDSLTLGLEGIARREVSYRGVRLSEMDVASILARRPEVVLIDELAHTNVPGSPNGKRYQDVLEVLAAGIHVITTLNVQHLESLYDTVERLIGVKVKERLPDWVIAEADQIVNVDLSAEDLHRRLEEGKVYAPERAAQALGGFFRKGNLEQLRELALREVASVIERRGRTDVPGERVDAPDQVVVCLSSRGPDPAALLRYASRLAGRLNRNWYALYVQTPPEEPERADDATQARIANALALATQLGAMVFTYKGEDVVDTVLRFAREYRIGHIVVGRPTPRTWWEKRRHGGSPAERLIAAADGMAVVVVDAESATAAAAPAAPPASAPPVTAPERTAPKLSELLPEPSVLFIDEPLSKSDLLARLVGSVQGPRFDVEGVLRQIARREAEASTFLSEGIALPHVRIPGLGPPRAALGLLRAGLTGGESPELVFLFLCPEEAPPVCLRLLASAARLFRDDRLRARLRQVTTAAQAVAAIREWEESGRAGHQVDR